VNVNEYCYSRGIIAYKEIDADDGRLIRGTWYVGRFGEEKPTRTDTHGDRARIYDPINCRISTIEDLARASKQTNRKTIPLLEEHGHVDLGPEFGPGSTQSGPARFFRAGVTEAITLPFVRVQILPPTTYYAFADAYVFRNLAYGKNPDGRSKSTAPRDPRIAWVLNPDGRISERRIIEGRWTGGPSLAPYLSVKGLVFVNPGSTKAADGIYLSVDGRVRKLLSGRVSQVGVSSDGCILAFTSAPSSEEDRPGKNRRTLKALNLCGS
jgi:hypothetical protein